MEKTKVKLTTDEIVTMCEKLSRRYRRPHMNDDLVSEGVLAVYERLETTPDEYPASLYRRANKAMYDYINVKTKAVTIPSSRTADSLMTGKDYSGQTHSEEGKRVLDDALKSTTVEFDEEFMGTVEDCTASYERKDYIEKGFKELNDREKNVVILRYFSGQTQDEVAEFYGFSRQYVSVLEEEALHKMSKV